jgi:hypothetical protein
MKSHRSLHHVSVQASGSAGSAGREMSAGTTRNRLTAILVPALAAASLGALVASPAYAATSVTVPATAHQSASIKTLSAPARAAKPCKAGMRPMIYIPNRPWMYAMPARPWMFAVPASRPWMYAITASSAKKVVCVPRSASVRRATVKAKA